jgi:hypothetical protein
MNKLLSALVMAMFLVGFTGGAFADEPKGGEMKGEAMKGEHKDMKGGEMKGEKKGEMKGEKKGKKK